LSELLGFTKIEKFTEFITASSKLVNLLQNNNLMIEGIMSEDKQYLMNKESFKIYDDHPWLTSKLTTHKLLVSKNLV